MILYNVTLKVENSVSVAWVQWMKTEHMKDLMDTGLFIECRLCHILEQDESDGTTYSAQYFCESLDQYNMYIDNYAKDMRERAFSAFGNKFVAFRTVMEII